MASIVCSVDVDRPVREVDDRWSRIDELPLILTNVVSIRRLDASTTRWVVRIAKEQREFDAVVTEEVPSLRMAWKGLGVPHQAGVVTFHRLTDRSSRMTVQLDWEPAGLFDRVGDRLGLVKRAVGADLQAFKRHVEGAPVAAAVAEAPADDPAGDVGRAAATPPRSRPPAGRWC